MNCEQESLAALLASQNPANINALLGTLSKEELEALEFDWKFWARPSQLVPLGDWWTIWLVLAGRGWGKSRTGAETVQQWKDTFPMIHFIAPTSADIRDVMVEGESGILHIAPPWDRPVYEPSKRKLTWRNGAEALLFSADEPDRLRGPQCYGLWADELATWRYAKETWDNAMFGFRMGTHPLAVITTTPKPIGLVKELIKRVGQDVVLTRGSTYENRANLAAVFFDQVISRYEGTNLGRQELHAEVIEDLEGSLWKRSTIELNRISSAQLAVLMPSIARIVIGVDPPGGATECGIVAAGKGLCYCKGSDKPEEHMVILEDASLQAPPNEWATAVNRIFLKRDADRVIGEKNYGGDMVESTIRSVNPSISYKNVSATRGKAVRAEPVAAKYEQGKVHHVGTFEKLEDEMCEWIPGKTAESPNRMDALVWCGRELMPDFNWEFS